MREDMSSKKKPISHLKSLVKKNRVQNLQKFTMKTIFDRFPHLSDDIFEYLDEKSFANCVEVNRSWQSAIANEKVYLKKKIQKWSKQFNEFSKEWSEALVKIPLELLRRLSEYTMEHNCLKCDYSRIPKNFKSCEIINDCKCHENSPIHVASRYGDIELFKHIEVKTENKSPKNCSGKTPLHLAAFEGHLEICKWYITNIGEVDNIDELGWTALHFAASNGQVEIFNYLLENGADLYRSACGQTTLHLAAKCGSSKICKLIVEVHKGLDINNKDYNGNTPIHFAVEESQLETVKYLFDKGGDLNSDDDEEDTPLHAAARFGNTEVVEFILEKVVDKNPTNKNGDTPLNEAAKKGFLEIVKLLFISGGDLNYRNIERDTPLHTAAMNGHTEVVKFILEKVVDKNPVNRNGDTPLHKAAKNGSLEICKLICQEDGDNYLERYTSLIKITNTLKDANEMFENSVYH